MRVRLISAEEARPLRASILRPGQAAEKSIYQDDDAPSALHLGASAEDGDDLVGVASFYNESPPFETNRAAWRLRGMAVVAAARGQGCGAELLSEGIALIEKREGKLLWCYARVSAADFYRRHGLTTRGEEFDADGYPHVLMWRRL